MVILFQTNHELGLSIVRWFRSLHFFLRNILSFFYSRRNKTYCLIPSTASTGPRLKFWGYKTEHPIRKQAWQKETPKLKEAGYSLVCQFYHSSHHASVADFSVYKRTLSFPKCTQRETAKTPSVPLSWPFRPRQTQRTARADWMSKCDVLCEVHFQLSPIREKAAQFHAIGGPAIKRKRAAVSYPRCPFSGDCK